MNQKTNKYTSGKLEEREPKKKMVIQVITAPEMFYKKVFWEKFAKIAGKSCAGSSFLTKFQTCTDTGIFLSILQKILITLFLVNTSGGYFFKMSPNLKRRRIHTI